MSKKRELLLEVAFEEIYHNGYYATSIDTILLKANASKSSMYHFFKSKKELALGIIQEKIALYIEDKYSPLLEVEENFIEEIMRVIKDRDDFDFNCGCKLNNLVQELSFQDKDFQKELEKIYLRFEDIFEIALDKAVAKQEIGQVDTKELSMFIVASIQGCISTAKKSQNRALYGKCIVHLERYLKSLSVVS